MRVAHVPIDPARYDELIALRATHGWSLGLIAKHYNQPRHKIDELLRKLNVPAPARVLRRVSAPRMPRGRKYDYSARVRVRTHLQETALMAAEKRNISVAELIQKLIDNALGSSLVDAVLDDGAGDD